jgi:hypothetical protein
MRIHEEVIRDQNAIIAETATTIEILSAENRRLQAAVETKIQAASISDGMTGRTEDVGWRKLTGNTERELSSMTFEQQAEIAYWLWRTNPLGHWIIEIITAFVAGNGFTIEAENDDIKTLLTNFWEHPANNMPVFIEKHTRELGIFGVLLLPKFTLQYTGKMAVGYVDPANIRKVVTDPQNVKMIIGVITKGSDMQDGRKYKTVLHPEAEEFLSPDARAWRDNCQAECFYHAINNVTNDPMGASDLFEIADWLDAYEQFLFDYADKWPMLNTFVWDMMVEGGDANAIAEQLKNFTKKSGSAFGHNEKVKLEPSTPDLKAVDAEKGAQLFRNHVLGAKSLPSFWYGGAQDSNLAVSQEMSAPTYKMMSARQTVVMSIIYGLLDEVIREADKAGMIKGVPEDQRGYTVNTPELANKDIAKFAQAIQQLSASLVSAETQGWVGKDDALKIFAFCLGLIGYELDIDAVIEAQKEAGDKKGYEDYLKKGKKDSGSAGMTVGGAAK